MHKFVVEAPGLMVGSGEIMALTDAQFDGRAHNVEVLDKHGKLTHVRVITPLQFKAGEELHMERVPKGATAPAASAPEKAAKPPKEKRDANGDTPEMAAMRRTFDTSYGQLQKKLEAEVTGFPAKLDAARLEGHAAGRAELLAEVKARNALFDAADEAAKAVDVAQAKLEAEADPDKRQALQKAVDAALEAQIAADDAADKLAELKA